MQSVLKRLSTSHLFFILNFSQSVNEMQWINLNNSNKKIDFLLKNQRIDSKYYKISRMKELKAIFKEK